jgi:branched-chain amino acid transport system ATP-binding protein
VTTPLLEVRDIHAAYGHSRALFGVSLSVPEGACVCLLGRNGVGKSTTMRAIMGLTPPSAGQILWKGTDIAGRKPFEIARAGIGFVPEDRRVFADLSVLDNLEVGARAAQRPGPWTVDAVFELFPKLRELSGRRSGYLSGGEQQMLTIGRTLMGNPELLLLDEPSEGLAPLVVETLLEQVGRLKQQGLTILLAEQGLHFSLALADYVYVLQKGAVRYADHAAALRDDPQLREDLLGVSSGS